MSSVIKWALVGTFSSIVAFTVLQDFIFEDDSGKRVAVAAQPRINDKAKVELDTAQGDTSSLSHHLLQACKATLAMMNSREAKTFNGYSIDAATAHVGWVSPDDGKKWQARCEIVDDNHIRWAAFDAFGDSKQGRWRDEDKIEVNFQKDSIEVKLHQAGMTPESKSFALDKLVTEPSPAAGPPIPEASTAKPEPNIGPNQRIGSTMLEQAIFDAFPSSPSTTKAKRRNAKNAADFVGATINAAGHLCARIIEVQEAAPGQYGVGCVKYRDGGGRAIYLIDSRTGSVDEI